MTEFMREAKNAVFVEGILLEKDVQRGVTKENKPYIRAEIKVLCRQNIDGKELETVVPIKFYANMYKKDTEIVSRLYTGIEEIEKFQSAADTGDEKTADAIRVDMGSKNFRNGSLAENVYVPQGATKEISTVEINGTSVRKIDRMRLNPLTKFSTEIVVYGIKEEVVDGEVTGAIIVTGLVVRYQDRVDMIDFKVVKPNAINHINNNWERGMTVLAEGYLNFINKTYTVSKDDAGFGDPIDIPVSRFVKELIITSGSAGSIDKEFAYDKAQLNPAISARLERIEKMKEPKEVLPNPGF